LHEAHAQLYPAPLPVGDSMHVPVEVHVEYIQQSITPFFVAITPHRVEKVLHYNVTTYDRIHGPVVCSD
jgi:hypothetical protein